MPTSTTALDTLIPAVDGDRVTGLYVNEIKENEIKENEILRALPAEEFARVQSKLEFAALPLFQVLYDFGAPIEHLYFPARNTIVSMLCRSDERVHVEVTMCGSEGAVGMSALFGLASSPFQHLVQATGRSYRMGIADAIQEFRRGDSFQALLMKSMNAQLIEVSQTALCNRIHPDDERLARWLLISNDRVEFNQLPLPIELLARMLGRSHSGVSVAASTLQRAGLISYNGAEIEILDRERLETVACSCYWVVKRHVSSFSREELHAEIGPVSGGR
jgi:CRP-like cAMP-binding protein